MTDATAESRPSNDEGGTPAAAWRQRRRRAFGSLAAPETLEEAIEAGEIERSDATFAAELVALADLGPRPARALFEGLLAAAAARRRGSVRLDVTSGATGALAGRLSELVPSLFDDPERARTSAELLRDVLRSESAEPLVGEGDDYRPLTLEAGHLYRHRDWMQEGRLARAVSSRIVGAWREEWPADCEWPPDEIRSHLEELVETFEPAPTPEQQYAVVTAATAPLSVVTGGPGTGKTSLVVSLLRLLVGLGVEPDQIALAAPTGKAADRLGQSIREQLVEAESGATAGSPEQRDRLLREGLEEPATIHRLLGYSERRREFHHDEYRPLPYEYVVVDEASMIDLELMDRLVAAIEQDAKLVLVGDADQLPAVGSGAVFRDLVPEPVQTATARRSAIPAELPATQSDRPLAAQAMQLTTNFRMRPEDPAGSNVLAVARAVRDGGERLRFSDSGAGAGDSDPRAGADGTAAQPVVDRRESFAELRFAGAELLSGATPDWLEEWYGGPLEERVLDPIDWREPVRITSDGAATDHAERLRRLFEAFERCQLLGVTRRRRRGVGNLDARLHRHHVQRHGLSVDAQFAIGEPVMMTRNDYERGLFNGDRGVVLPVLDDRTADPYPRAVFPRRDGYEAFALGPLSPELDRAWSITVHKSQGSEYESVGIVLPGESIPLATRELLYTGITRARRSVTFFGTAERIRDAAARTDERNTGLVERVERQLRE